MALAPRAAGLGKPDGYAGVPLWMWLLAIVAAGLVGGLAAAPISQLGTKGLVAAVGAVGAGLCFLVARPTPLVGIVLVVLTMQVPMRRSLTAVAADISGGPPSVYLATIDVVLLLLYAHWLAQGTLLRDLGAALRRPQFYVPLFAIVLLVPSLAVAVDLPLAFGEIHRALWAFAVYAYVALRLTTRREIAHVLAALLLVVAVQAAIAGGQWATKGSLGLAILGELPEFEASRVGREDEIPRPAGTIVHPVMFGALMGPLGILALSLAMNLRRPLLRLACLAFVPLALGAVWLAQARGATLGLIAAIMVLVPAHLLNGRVPLRAVAAVLAVVAAVAFGFREQISQRIIDNVYTDHFLNEVESRIELNVLALDIVRDYPIFGVGINNFERRQEEYDWSGLIFAGHPVHNLFLLLWAEAGLVGLAGLALTFAVLVPVALRLARSRDDLLRAVGVAVAGAYLFYVVEEMLMFSLRHDVPRTTFWVLAGLTVACSRIAASQSRRPRFAGRDGGR
jgi:O-antigen ligase